MRADERGSASEQFVVTAVRSYATNTPAPRPPDTDEWIDVAERADVLPTVMTAVRAAGWTLPRRAQASRFLSSAALLRAMAELGAVSGALDAIGSRWVVLKGPVLAQTVYRLTTTRSYGDLDVLVHPLDLHEALLALERNGFVVVDRNWPLIARSGRGEISLLGKTGMLLDLHWHAGNERHVRSDLPLDWAGMLDRRIHLDIEGLSVPSLDNLDLTVYIALHASLSGGHHLKWLLDIQQAIFWADPSAQQLSERADLHGLTLIVQTMLQHAACHVDARLQVVASSLGGSLKRDARKWAALCTAVSARALPLGSSPGRRSGRSVFAATRSTTLSSARAFAAAAGSTARAAIPGLADAVDVDTLREAVGDEADRARWLADVAAFR